jgi:hypothetical protein
VDVLFLLKENEETEIRRLLRQYLGMRQPQGVLALQFVERN